MKVFGIYLFVNMNINGWFVFFYNVSLYLSGAILYVVVYKITVYDSCLNVKQIL